MTAVLRAVMDIQGHGDVQQLTDYEGQTMQNIVNWLSICFVKKGKGDVVACGIQFKSQNATIYFCNNEVVVEAEDTQIAKQFESLTNEVISKPATNDPLSSCKLRDGFLTAIGSRAWELILAKKKNLYIDSDSYSSFVFTNKQISDTIKPWIKYRKEDSGLTRRELEIISKGVTSHINSLLDLELDTSLSSDKRRLAIKVIAFHATRVLSSAFMIDVSGTDYGKALDHKEDLAFLKRVYRRLWRLSRFYTGVDGYLSGLRELHSLTGPKKTDKFEKFQVQFVWIQALIKTDIKSDYNVGIALEYPKYSAYLESERKRVLSDCRNISTGDENALQLAIEDALNSFQKAKNTTIVEGVHTFQCVPKYHCEIQLAQFFLHNRIRQRTIGCSKLKCWSCNKFLDKITSITTSGGAIKSANAYGPWHLSGTSAKSHFAWRIPDKELFTNMDQNLWGAVKKAGDDTFREAKKELYEVLKNIYLNGGGPKPEDPKSTRFTHNRNKSFGSDSSTGSNWPVPVYQIVFDEETIHAATHGII